MGEAAAGGALSLVPSLTVLGLAIRTRRPLESLLVGALVGHLLLSGTAFLGAFLDSALSVMAEPASGWVVLVVSLFGALIGILARTGAATAFGAALSARLRGPRQMLLGAFGLGLVTFVDDYLNALAVGAAFRSAADRLRISRARLAYVVDSTAAPVCVLAPVSTWAVFLTGLFEEHGVAAAGEGFGLYLSLIPFLLYPWFALLLVFLTILGVVPVRGPLAASERAARAGEPPTAAAMDEALLPEAGSGPPRRPRLGPAAFALPLLTLPAATLAAGGDALHGVVGALGVALLLAALLRPAAGPGSVADGAVRGMEQMVYPLGIVLASFVLREVNDALGLTAFVIGGVAPVASAWILPALVFPALSAVAFATGSFWGVYTVALPVVLGLSRELGAPLELTLGALISAGAFGSHACFYGDATVLSARSAGCSITEHVKTQLPYTLVAAGLATAGFAILGRLLA